jgi:hypothetical protein
MALICGRVSEGKFVEKAGCAAKAACASRRTVLIAAAGAANAADPEAGKRSFRPFAAGATRP